MISAVFFDVGGTLLYDDPPVPEVFVRVAKRLGYDIDLSDVLPCMPQVDRFYQEEYLRDGDFWCDHDRAVNIWLDMYVMMAEYAGIHEGTSRLAQAVYDEYLKPENWSLFADAEPCLKELKRLGLRLGVISNWDATLETLIRNLGYLPYFDEVIASAAVGCRKPDRAIFDIALERMGVDASQAVHVGDLPEADGDGAAGAGIRPVIIDRKNAHPDTPYMRISSLEDLPSALSRKSALCQERPEYGGVTC